MAKKKSRPAESWTYLLVSDRELPIEEQSRFTLSPLTQAERAAIQDDLARTHVATDGSKSVVARTRRQGLSIALDHIVAIENFPAGAPQPWPKDREGRETYLEMLDDDFVQEIGNEVFERSSVGVAEKNS